LLVIFFHILFEFFFRHSKTRKNAGSEKINDDFWKALRLLFKSNIIRVFSLLEMIFIFNFLLSNFCTSGFNIRMNFLRVVKHRLKIWNFVRKIQKKVLSQYLFLPNNYRVRPKETQWVLFEFVCEKSLSAKNFMTFCRRIRKIFTEFLSGNMVGEILILFKAIKSSLAGKSCLLILFSKAWSDLMSLF
jgi:hypothetical protein